MSQPASPLSERDVFEQTIAAANPQVLGAARFIFDHAPAPMNTVAYVRSICVNQDCLVRLLEDLHEHIAPEDLAPRTETNSTQCDVWSFFGVLLMLQGKPYQALEVFDALYSRLLCHQDVTGDRFHKGLALFHMSQCYQSLGLAVHAKRYMMLTLCEDAVTGGGTLNLRNIGTYGRLAWLYGLSDQQIRRYVEQAHEEYVAHEAEAAKPEWILQQLDQHWKTEIPSAQEAGMYRITPNYCEFLAGRLGAGDGNDLDRLAEYLVGAMPGCRTYRRARTYSTDYDVIASVEGPIADFRSELGRYFVCECKDRTKDKASFPDVAKFCRVLDSVKAKLGIIFCTSGHSGDGEAVDADREILKFHQDRGIVIVVVDRADLQRVAEGTNFISILREKYEVVRLDLRLGN
jgi:hypothetical protein